MVERFLSQTSFTTQEDFIKNFKINVPENFNFGYDVVDAWAAEQPDKPALLWTNDKGEHQQFTFADMKRYTDMTASYFQSLGIGHGDMVMLILKRRFEFWFSIIALHKLGAVVIPATHLLTKKDIVYRCNAADIKMIVCAGESVITDHIVTAMPDSPSVKKLVSVGPEIAEGSMTYPADWNEFEDGEGSFLFYNPNEWTGNFRISAFKGNATYGKDSVKQELRENSSAIPVRIGRMECAYSKEMFEEEGAYYTSHLWITGADEVAFECSFTVKKGEPVAEAEKIIASLETRKDGVKYPAEIIPVRLSEIYQINEAYEWVDTTIKELLKKDFQGAEEDIAKMQQMMEESNIGPKKKDAWLAFGIALCVIFANEVDGMEWRTLVDGNREAPILLNTSTGEWIDPMKLVWSKVKAGGKVNLPEIYSSLF